MKISTKGRYGLRAMLDLAVNARGEHVSLNSIAARQNISENYLEQVFSLLRKAGLVKSIKGPQGGYTLGMEPSKIKVGDILRVLEGDLLVVDEKNNEILKDNNFEYCLQLNVWNKMNESINAVVDSMTLEDLLQEYRKINTNQSYMYYI
ncbi:MAG TPA: Rrf2 family transcriptional regulator [Ruminiclostridium sp.]|jgi:Rrf2 family protein|uniref:HTH-type transcriptional regulator CymR n=1 Tax=Acetivibrio saccincola TaxID=1677857 RepID=A0A2K9ELP9_9FIRM|nr:Rrf2 family transcriptional regulator [Acetivibrio saccincola]HAA42585.1 Rrf2 family transcriptional regulator [Ruminiclostridium sp.]AUG57511.1 HTH-type transcriptional regulator CymR [Acetivibrio saccincola]NLW28034.1 Rrf2 family transcriptional regulator [Acetivibrio saccincola]PQQ67427.1 Rrf2 family transcriptional regulator [Acetivibrio saccincola]HQD29332.1 Rrf2 family transcriptional regulator [Acetivibrio saccincola]